MAAIVNTQECNGCGDCVKECPVHAITMANDLAVVDTETCTDCGSCIDVCPKDAIGMP